MEETRRSMGSRRLAAAAVVARRRPAAPREAAAVARAVDRPSGRLQAALAWPVPRGRATTEGHVHLLQMGSTHRGVAAAAREGRERPGAALHSLPAELGTQVQLTYMVLLQWAGGATAPGAAQEPQIQEMAETRGRGALAGPAWSSSGFLKKPKKKPKQNMWA